MASYNFEFLHKYYPEVARIGVIAEQLLQIDPSSCIVKIRYMAEKLTKHLYDQFQLTMPIQPKFSDLLHDYEFSKSVPAVVVNKFHYIRREGNNAVHGDASKVTQLRAISVLKEAFDISKWYCKIIHKDPICDLPVFKKPVFGKKDETAKYRKEQQKLEADIKKKDKEVDELLKQLDEKDKEQEALRKSLKEKTEAEKHELKAKGQKVANSLGFNEAETRKKLIDVMLAEAGWNVDDPDEVGIEVEIKHQPTDSGIGKADYVLWGDDGNPLAVIEAKKTSRSHQEGKEQARMYAEGFEKEHGRKPVIFYTNGFEISIWEGPSSRKVYGFYSKTSLEYLIYQRKYKNQNLEACNPNPKITDRLYQINAIKKVANRLQNHYRKALIVQATGTGKTRVAIALSELLLKNAWAKRILFLCDRVELRKQAHDNYKEHLPDEPRVYASQKTKHDQSARIYFATYPGMARIFNSFDIGFFDLIIADESHRSIYNKYREIFMYFDSIQVGLTATPVNFIHRNTYSLFQCDEKDPTAYFSLEEAINNDPPYLVPFKVKDLTTKFLREGIKYSNLTDEQKQQLEDDQQDAEALDFDPKALDKEIFNKDTNRIILRNLMENGIKNADGSLVGKSIVFARSRAHADLLQDLFVELYPQYGEKVCKTIYSGLDDGRASALIDEFKGFKGETDFSVAISVDMLDTGVDIPEVVNLVFAKPMKSFVKFWQMIGRGTRICKDMFGPGKDKTEFHIFDHWENFKYFEQEYEEVDRPPQNSPLTNLFLTRLALSKIALSKSNQYSFDLGCNLMLEDIHALPTNSVNVKEKIRSVEEMKTESLIRKLSQSTQTKLQNDIAPLMKWRELKGRAAVTFDILMVNIQVALLTKSSDLETYKMELFEQLNRLAVNINHVRTKMDLIQELQSAEYWEKVIVETLEDKRLALRGIMKYKIKGPPSPKPVVTDIKEDESEIVTEDHVTALAGTDEYVYRSRVQKVLTDMIKNNHTLQKIKMDLPVSDNDLDELCSLVLAQNPGLKLDTLTEFYPVSVGQLKLAIRALIGLEKKLVEKHFTEFVQDHPELTAQQVQFIDTLKNHIVKNGFINTDQLFEKPFTGFHSNGVDGVFQEGLANELINIVKIFNPPLGLETEKS
jgi:type I restriction enzyme, R subunit